jgi:glycosyltransferase involved in cell wall biosynthesis
MKRIFHIVRGYGLSALLRRAAARAAARFETARRAAAARRADRLAMRLPKSPEALGFAKPKNPLVTVLIIEARDWRHANRCLRSLQRAQRDVSCEVIVACDPRIEEEMRMHEGIGILPSPRSLAFSHLLAQAASLGNGDYLAVLDSNAVAGPGALARLAAMLERDVEIAVAVPVVGRVAAQLDFVRDVEYAPPWGSMFRMDFLRSALTGLSRSGVTSDVLAQLCAHARVRKMRCVYQPLARVMGGSAEPRTVPAAASLLVVDDHVPFDDRDAGSRRMAALLSFARAKRWSVVFGSLEDRAYEPYGERLTQSGVELILRFGKDSFAQLKERGSAFDCIWLCRPQIAAEFIAPARSFAPGSKIVYDTVDLHHLRLARQDRIRGRKSRWNRVEHAELDAARRSDAVVVTSAAEKELLIAKGIANVEVVGLAERLSERTAAWEATSGILFVGNYAHEPNVDAAIWLVREIMPLIWEQLPDVRLTLAGADPTSIVRRLAGPRVIVTGFIPSLDSTLATHRVFAAPLRFGAGLKGKIVQAIAAGLPVVTTAIGAEGIASNEDELALADNARSFAAVLVSIYRDKAQWRKYSEGARRAALRFAPEELARQFYDVIGIEGTPV